MTLFVTALDKVHDVKKFKCGNEDLDRWLDTIARQHQKNSLSQTFVLVDDHQPGNILGFYALGLRGLIASEELPKDLARRLPRTVPGITLGRLAVSEEEQGKGYGEYLLVDAMERARTASRGVGGWALFVDAKDDQAATFDKKYGFTPVPSNPRLLFIPFADMPA